MIFSIYTDSNQKQTFWLDDCNMINTNNTFEYEKLYPKTNKIV